MKLKTLALLAASAIGVNASALDLNGRTDLKTNTNAKPTAITSKYYTNSAGQLYLFNDDELSLLYDLDDGHLIDVDEDQALGVVTLTGHAGGNYYLCPVERCDNNNERKYIEGVDYFGAESNPSYRANHNSKSGYGETLVVSRPSSGSMYTSEFQVSIVDDEANILDSFMVEGGVFTYGNYTAYYPVGTTGITREKEFKFLSTSHGEYVVSLLKWNDTEKRIVSVPLYLNNGQELNTAYPEGLAPFSISDPFYDDSGEKLYNVVLAKVSDKNAGVSSDLLWGKIKVEEGSATFVDELKTAPQSFPLYIGALSTNEPIFFNQDTFLYSSYKLDLGKSGPDAISSLEIGHDTRTFSNRVYMLSDNGQITVLETNVGMTVFAPWALFLTANSSELDPYNDPYFNLKVSSSASSYYGIEATCSLQTTNATVDSNNYIDLSETALQIPIEWDAVTGEWKGAQSLTGLESLSGSKDFAQFNLTADVTTGTWTMNCSGIASDIEGNKIELNPAEITINLDDQIHGGSSVISGQIQIPNTTDYSGVVVTITLNGRQIEVTTMEDGSFEFDRLVEGDYTVHVYSEQYVAACNNLTLDGTNAAAPLTIEMYAGDINNDGAVDIGDFSYLSSLYGLSSADEQYDALADLNHDGTINVQDLSILGSHFGTDHCEVVPE